MRWRLSRGSGEEAVAPVQAPSDGIYARWAPFYPPTAHNALMTAEEAAVRELLPTVAARTVLDAGCGTGRYLSILARAGAHAPVGVDRSREMLARAAVPGARLVLADIRNLPLAGRSFDAVICGLTLMDVADLDLAIGELTRVLKLGGVLVYSILHPVGATQGWTRSFDTPDGREVIASSWHSIEANLNACRSAGLVVDARREPTVGANASLGNSPVALVIRATRVL